MTDQDNGAFSYSHDELMKLIPWYVKGKLAADENAALQQHLADCQSCRQEISNCQTLAGSLPQAAESWKPSAVHFAGILDRVEKFESGQKPELSAKTGPIASYYQRILQLFAQTPRPVRWTLAAESLAFAIIAAVLVPGQFHIAEKDKFETLSTVDAPAPAGQVLRLVFSEDMTAKELSALLNQAKAQIRQGPSAVGAYTVEIASEDEAQGQAVLRAHPKIKLVLPVATNTETP
jgi:anti-sigma factor RsiW